MGEGPPRRWRASLPSLVAGLAAPHDGRQEEAGTLPGGPIHGTARLTYLSYRLLAYRAPGFVDRGYTASGYVVDKYERKGNQYIVVDSMTVDEDGREIVRSRYTSLVRLRSEG